ncbi:MAG: XRE family transcriptional regulator [Parvibaculum sp.]|nr:XRE family transcriptional regulator [Parvibaculum sp.]
MDDTSTRLSQRLSGGRKTHGWSLADLATRSGVSKAMLSKIERCEVSPTASVLMRIATAFNITLAELLTDASAEAHYQRAADQPAWTDPATDYFRRQVYLTSRLPLELVEVVLPAKTTVAIPASSYVFIRQVVWVIEGQLTIVEGDRETKLATGDRLEFGPPADCAFRNDGSTPCRYLVAVLRQR